MKNPPIIKVLLGGDGGTGKTTFLLSNQQGTFTEATLTIGVEVFIASRTKKQNDAKLLVFDLGGQERFQFLHDAFTVGTKAIILFYDLSRHMTFQHLRKWIMFLNTSLRVPVLICGTKSDLVTETVIKDFRNEFKNLQNSHPIYNDVVDHLVFSSKNQKKINHIFERIWEIVNTLPRSENIVSPARLKSPV